MDLSFVLTHWFENKTHTNLVPYKDNGTSWNLAKINTDNIKLQHTLLVQIQIQIQIQMHMFSCSVKAAYPNLNWFSFFTYKVMVFQANSGKITITMA